MSNASSNWLELPLAPPRWLLPAVIVLAVLAMLAVWISAAPRWMLLLPALILPLSWLRLARSPRGRLHFRDDGSLLWMDRENGEHELRLLGVASRGPLQVLRLVDGDRVITALFCRPGNLDATQQRRLTLWLRRHAVAIQAADPLEAP